MSGNYEIREAQFQALNFGHELMLGCTELGEVKALHHGIERELNFSPLKPDVYVKTMDARACSLLCRRAQENHPF